MRNSNRLRKILVRMFLLCGAVCVSSHVNAMSAYSEVWYDESSSTFYGCGVSASEYYSTIHNLKVTTRFTSPNGRTASSLTTGFTYARADVSIPQVEGDDGDYVVISDFEAECSHIGGSHTVAFSIQKWAVGKTSFISFEITGESNINGQKFYRKVTPCVSACSSIVADGKWIDNDVPHELCHTELHLYSIINGHTYCQTWGIGRMHNGPCVCL